MVASPNYMFGVYDGDNSGGTARAGLHPGRLGADRGRLRALLHPAAASRSRTASSPAAPTTARSSPSASRRAACSPAPRCPRPTAEAALYGGVAGAAFDPCYHEFCDNLRGDGQNAALYAQLREDYELVGNINVDALDVNADAIATAVLTFAYDTSTVNAVAGKPGKSNGLYKNRASR